MRRCCAGAGRVQAGFSYTGISIFEINPRPTAGISVILTIVVVPSKV